MPSNDSDSISDTISSRLVNLVSGSSLLAQNMQAASTAHVKMMADIAAAKASVDSIAATMAAATVSQKGQSASTVQTSGSGTKSSGSSSSTSTKKSSGAGSSNTPIDSLNKPITEEELLKRLLAMIAAGQASAHT